MEKKRYWKMCWVCGQRVYDDQVCKGKVKIDVNNRFGEYYHQRDLCDICALTYKTQLLECYSAVKGR